MTAPTPLTAHEEIDFLDAVERALAALTTAELEGAIMQSDRSATPPQPPLAAKLKTVIPAQAGTHTTFALRRHDR
jgi:hypothetical protein